MSAPFDDPIIYNEEHVSFVRQFYDHTLKSMADQQRENKLIYELKELWASYDKSTRLKLAKQLYLRTIETETLLLAMNTCTQLNQFNEYVRLASQQS